MVGSGLSSGRRLGETSAITRTTREVRRTVGREDRSEMVLSQGLTVNKGCIRKKVEVTSWDVRRLACADSRLISDHRRCLWE